MELLSEIILLIDLRCLTDFRRDNQRAMQVVDSISQYRTILAHSPGSLRGTLIVETASFISCRDLFDILCTAKCEECEDFGGFICMLTCRRICFLCLSENPNYHPLLVCEAVRKFGLDSKLLAMSTTNEDHPRALFAKRAHQSYSACSDQFRIGTSRWDRLLRVSRCDGAVCG